MNAKRFLQLVRVFWLFLNTKDAQLRHTAMCVLRVDRWLECARGLLFTETVQYNSKIGMEIKFTFDAPKAIATILYVAKRLSVKRPGHRPDYYKILKIIFYAEAEHMKKYGLPIIGDQYYAMRHGPVPSHSYDLIKIAKGDTVFSDPYQVRNYFEIHNEYHLQPLQEPDMDEFSQSNLECLDETVEAHCSKTFNELHKESSTKAYNTAGQNDIMEIAAIVEDFGGSEEAIEMLREHAENQRVFPSIAR